ncbi:MAG: hypothetical protein WCF84_15940 [Anaerolineae bacterium]
MNRLYSIFSVALCLLLLQSCSWLGPDPQKQKEARLGLDQAVAQLPQVKELAIVKVVYYDVFDNEHGTNSNDTCYYARAYFVIGTQLSVTEALDTYARQLELLGWVPRNDQYPTSRVLYHGPNELLVIESGAPGAELENAVDYNELRKIYRNIVFLNLTYALQSC